VPTQSRIILQSLEVWVIAKCSKFHFFYEAIMAKDTLQNTLQALLQSGTTSNPALNGLIGDYTKYHVVLVVVGGLFLVSLILLSLFFWRQFQKGTGTNTRRWTFEKKTHFYLGVSSVFLSLFMALVFAANISTVLEARKEFSVAVGTLERPQVGTPKDKRYQSFESWLQSGSSQMPTLIQSKINHRLAWQQPKAIICSVLLVVFLVLSTRVWQSLIRKSRVTESKWKFKDRALFVSGVVGVISCSLLMLMVIGNTQASIAPIFLTLSLG
jgi:hypothetical protein